MSLSPLFLTACASPSPTSPSQDPPPIIQTAYGKVLYDDHCADCHDGTDLHLLKDPPNLDGMFAKPTLPSGAPATDEEVRAVIQDGRGIMPPFRTTMSDKDVADLVLYLHAMKPGRAKPRH